MDERARVPERTKNACAVKKESNRFECQPHLGIGKPSRDRVAFNTNEEMNILRLTGIW